MLKTTYLIMGQHLPRLGKYLPDLPTFAKHFCEDSPDSPKFAKPCCEDSPDSLTFAKGHFWEKCDSPWYIRTSNERVTQIWGEWPLLNKKPKRVKNNIYNCNKSKLLKQLFQNGRVPKIKIFQLLASGAKWKDCPSLLPNFELVTHFSATRTQLEK